MDNKYPAPMGPIGQSVMIQNKRIPMKKNIVCFLFLFGLINLKYITMHAIINAHIPG
jgi:hypothetical protein